MWQCCPRARCSTTAVSAGVRSGHPLGGARSHRQLRRGCSPPRCSSWPLDGHWRLRRCPRTRCFTDQSSSWRPQWPPCWRVPGGHWRLRHCCPRPRCPTDRSSSRRPQWPPRCGVPEVIGGCGSGVVPGPVVPPTRVPAGPQWPPRWGVPEGHRWRRRCCCPPPRCSSWSLRGHRQRWRCPRPRCFPHWSSSRRP